MEFFVEETLQINIQGAYNLGCLPHHEARKKDTNRNEVLRLELGYWYGLQKKTLVTGYDRILLYCFPKDKE